MIGAHCSAVLSSEIAMLAETAYGKSSVRLVPCPAAAIDTT